MKIIIVSYAYYSPSSPRSIRWSALADYWSKQGGHHVDVITYRDGTAETVEQRENLRIFRVASFLEKNKERLRQALVKDSAAIEQIKNNAEKKSAVNAKNSMARLLKSIYRNTWAKIYWPDYACFWFFPARKKLMQLIKENQYDVLISVSLPFTSHLVGYSAARRYPQLNWVVDSGDPFSYADNVDSNNHRFYKKLNKLVEKTIFKKCQSLSFTTEKTASIYAEYFKLPELLTKSHIISVLLNNPNTEIRAQVFSPGQHHVAFVGTLYPKIRSPDFFMQILEYLSETNIDGISKFSFHFIGSHADCRNIFERYSNARKLVTLHEMTSRNFSYSAECQAEILLNLGNLNPYQLPSKLTEYIKTGKPIINISYHEEDSSNQFLTGYPLYCNIRADLSLESQASKFYDFLSAQAGKMVDQDFIRSFLKPYSIESISAQYETLFVPKAF